MPIRYEYADAAETMTEEEFRRLAIVAMARVGITESEIKFGVRRTVSGGRFWYCFAEAACCDGMV